MVFSGKVSNFNQSEAIKHCFLASDWSKFKTLPRKYRTLFLLIQKFFKERGYRLHKDKLQKMSLTCQSGTIVISKANRENDINLDFTKYELRLDIS